MSNVKPIPEGFHSITPHLVCRDAASAIEFYRTAFGATLLDRHDMPDGKIMHASMRIGDSIIMLNDEFPDWQSLGPQSIGGSPVTIHLYVEDADETFRQAVEAGATATMPPMDAFWGSRYGKLTDPFGHEWSIATQIEEVTGEEMKKRAEEFFAGACQG